MTSCGLFGVWVFLQNRGGIISFLSIFHFPDCLAQYQAYLLILAAVALLMLWIWHKQYTRADNVTNIIAPRHAYLQACIPGIVRMGCKC